MIFPDDLPGVLVYRLGTYPDRDGVPAEIIKRTYPRRPVASVGTSGKTDAAMICPTIPYGCTGWQRVGETEWHPLADLPPHWLPFLQRERGTEMDFRAPPCPQCGHDTGARGQLCARCRLKTGWKVPVESEDR